MGMFEYIRVMLVQDLCNNGPGGLEERILKEYDEFLVENKEMVRKAEPDFVELIVEGN
jgi:hypothetical protein